MGNDDKYAVVVIVVAQIVCYGWSFRRWSLWFVRFFPLFLEDKRQRQGQRKAMERIQRKGEN